jgi:hypothetical protein
MNEQTNEQMCTITHHPLHTQHTQRTHHTVKILHRSDISEMIQAKVLFGILYEVNIFDVKYCCHSLYARKGDAPRKQV